MSLVHLSARLPLTVEHFMKCSTVSGNRALKCTRLIKLDKCYTKNQASALHRVDMNKRAAISVPCAVSARQIRIITLR